MNSQLPLVHLGRSDLRVSAICLGTMTFGEQVDEPTAHAILDRALERGVDFVDTAEMYSVPARRETFGLTETLIGNWLAARPGVRRRVVLATKVCGPWRGMDWIRDGSRDLRAADIVAACEASLARLRTDHVDLYQIHWPNRNAPSFGTLYFDPTAEAAYSPVLEQLEALDRLVRTGKVRYVGLSNETPWGVCEFLRLAERHALARVVSVQNPYALTSRAVDNGLDEVLYRSGVSLLAYSPLGFGALTGKYDQTGLDGAGPIGRLARFDSMKKQRWGRARALEASRRYSALARRHGLTPTRMALAFCYRSWRVASTIIGVTTLAQLDENVDAWATQLAPELLAEIDAIRLDIRDPAQ